ncbi:MAG TPA: sigma-70 region 4 domain-containing protein [Solirubrobacteraceae bacterium]
MSRLDELPPDQRAALSLLLRQRKSYAEVAAMLGISDGAVHDRAHAALAVLAPRQARGLTPAQREDVGNYLLSQQPAVADRMRTRTMLAGSAPTREWAHALTQELAILADGALPEVPADEAPPATAPASRPASAVAAAVPVPPAVAAPTGRADERLRAAAEQAPNEAAGTPAGGSASSSRLGGALLLGVIVIGIIVAIILVTNGSGRKTTRTTATTTSKTTGPTVNARIAMHSPSRASRGEGQVDVLSEGAKRAFYIVAQHLPPTHGFFYALWLYNSVSSHEPLSRGPAVGANGRMEGGALLPANAGEFRVILLTRETKPHPTHPGLVILRGRFTLGA